MAEFASSPSSPREREQVHSGGMLPREPASSRPVQRRARRTRDSPRSEFEAAGGSSASVGALDVLSSTSPVVSSLQSLSVTPDTSDEEVIATPATLLSPAGAIPLPIPLQTQVSVDDWSDDLFERDDDHDSIIDDLSSSEEVEDELHSTRTARGFWTYIGASPRWGHSACLLHDRYMFVFGGCGSSGGLASDSAPSHFFYSDAHWCDIHQNRWLRPHERGTDYVRGRLMMQILTTYQKTSGAVDTSRRARSRQPRRTKARSKTVAKEPRTVSRSALLRAVRASLHRGSRVRSERVEPPQPPASSSVPEDLDGIHTSSLDVEVLECLGADDIPALVSTAVTLSKTTPIEQLISSSHVLAGRLNTSMSAPSVLTPPDAAAEADPSLQAATQQLHNFHSDSDLIDGRRPSQELERVMPGTRAFHTAVAHGNRVFVFGGLNEEGVHGDLYVYDLTTGWSKPETRGPAPRPRAHHMAVMHNRRMYLFGGLAGCRRMYVLDVDRLVWQIEDSAGTMPTFTPGLHACCDGSKIYVFGGTRPEDDDARQPVSDRLYAYDLSSSTWSLLHGGHEEGLSPASRTHYSLCAGGGGLLWLFGGLNPHELPLQDLWCFDTLRKCWHQPDASLRSPCARSGHSSVVVSDRFLIVFGGMDPDNSLQSVFNDIAVLDLNSLLRDPSASPRVHLDEELASDEDWTSIDLDLHVHPHQEQRQRETLARIGRMCREVADQCQQATRRQEGVAAAVPITGLDADEPPPRRPSSPHAPTMPTLSRRRRQAGMSQIVVLDVGGKLFRTSVDTIGMGNHALAALFSRDDWADELDDERRFFIDRDPTYFRYVLNYLRDGTVVLPEEPRERMELLAEARYFQLNGLVQLIMRKV